ncbi:hypothetical protein BKI52_43635 [marine bacterium AO1-C]|nr:hypothetical protein BKI52_43635 [marine bacterium AO1-C]
MEDYISIDLKGFDKHGEPTIRMMNDGVLYLVIQFVPPTWMTSQREINEFYDYFNYELHIATGLTDILWEDKEFFRIENPNSDTVSRLRHFIENYKKNRTDFEILINTKKIEKTIYFGHNWDLWEEICHLLGGYDDLVSDGTQKTRYVYIEPENYKQFVRELIHETFVPQVIEDFLLNDATHLEYLGEDESEN